MTQFMLMLCRKAMSRSCSFCVGEESVDTLHNIRDILGQNLLSGPARSISVSVLPGVLDPQSVLPTDVLEKLRSKGSENEKDLTYLAGVWHAVSNFGIDPDPLFQEYLRNLKNYVLPCAAKFCLTLQRQASQAILEAFSMFEDEQQRKKCLAEYLWEKRLALAPMFAAETHRGLPRGRREIAEVLGTRDPEQFLKEEFVNRKSDIYFTTAEYLLAVADDGASRQLPLVAASATLLDQMPWQSIEQDLARQANKSDDPNFIPYGELEALVASAVAWKAKDNATRALEKIDAVAASLTANRDPNAILEAVRTNFPNDAAVIQLSESLLRSLFDWKTNPDTILNLKELLQAKKILLDSVGNSSMRSIGPRVTQRLLKKTELIAVLTKAIESQQQKSIDFVKTVMRIIREMAVSPDQKNNKSKLRVEIDENYLIIDLQGGCYVVVNTSNPSELKTGVERTQYTTFAELEAALPDQVVVSLSSNKNKALQTHVQKEALKRLQEGLLQRLEVTKLLTEIGNFRVTVAGDFVRKPEESLIGAITNAVAEHLYSHWRDYSSGKGKEKPPTDNVRVDVEIHPQLGNLPVEVDDPDTCKLHALSLASISDTLQRLLLMGEDVEVPKVTLAARDSSTEIMNHSVYEALEEMHKNGFDAYLGGRMAQEFSGVAARVYVEESLRHLAYDIKDLSKPLAELNTWQQELLEKTSAVKRVAFLEMQDSLSEEENEELDGLSSAIEVANSKHAMTLDVEFVLLEQLKAASPQETIAGLPLAQYKERRCLLDEIFNFAVLNGLPQYERDDILTQTSSRMYYSAGEFRVSSQAQKHFGVKAEEWDTHLNRMTKMRLSDESKDLARIAVIDLARRLKHELDEMAGSKITDRALQILRGTVAKVGEEIQQVPSSFFEAIKRILMTPTITLVVGKDGKLGWTINTRKETLRGGSA